jgi:TRAP-type C4-dicarboxylate transport system permease small subunit
MSLLAPAQARAPPRGRVDAIAAKIEEGLHHAAELPAAVLVVAEIVVLFVGVVFRYALDSPLVWTGELASILFLWLAMLGSVIALQRSGHMRLTAVVGRFGARGQARAEALVAAAVASFLVLIVPLAWSYSANQRFIITC